MTANVAYLDESTAAGWERTLYAFLAGKERRSGSLRTVQSYRRMIQHFFGRAGKTQRIRPGRRWRLLLASSVWMLRARAPLGMS